jgi:hypothetical protein
MSIDSQSIHHPKPPSQLSTFSLLPNHNHNMSGRGRKYDDDEEEPWDRSTTAQRRQQFFDRPPPSTALTRRPSSQTRTRNPNEPSSGPSTSRDDRQPTAQSGYNPAALAGASTRARSRSWERPDYGRNTVPSTYQDVKQERRRRSSPTKSMVTQPGDAAKQSRNRALSRNRYDQDEEEESHDERVRRERALAKRRSEDTADEARRRRAREAEDARRSSRYDDDRSRSRERSRDRDDTRRSGNEVARRAPDRDPNRTTRLSSQERRDRRVGFDPVETVHHLSDH